MNLCSITSLFWPITVTENFQESLTFQSKNLSNFRMPDLNVFKKISDMSLKDRLYKDRLYIGL